MDPTNDRLRNMSNFPARHLPKTCKKLLHELLLDHSSHARAAVDGTPFIGQDALVRRLPLMDQGSEVGPSTSTVALPSITFGSH
jgi:hypothetical protein